MFRRGLTGVVWLMGLAAVAYEDVVTPLAHAVFGDRVTHERVHEAEPEAVQAAPFAALIAPGPRTEVNCMDAVAELSNEEWEVARATAVRNMAARAPADACGDRAAVVARGLEGWL